eukprot:5194193-Alexandrium_andersonii.AAC.1
MHMCACPSCSNHGGAYLDAVLSRGAQLGRALPTKRAGKNAAPHPSSRKGAQARRAEGQQHVCL